MAYQAIGQLRSYTATSYSVPPAQPTCVTDEERVRAATDCKSASIAGLGQYLASRSSLGALPYTSEKFKGMDPCVVKNLPACPKAYVTPMPTITVCDTSQQGVLNWLLGKCPKSPTCVPDALFDAIGIAIANESAIRAWKPGTACPVAGIDCASAQAIFAKPDKWAILQSLPSCTGRKRPTGPAPTQAAAGGGFAGVGLLALVALGVGGGVWYFTRKKKAA